MEKREASDRVTGLEAEIAQAETAIGDAKAALKKMLEDKDEANRRIESLEEDYSHAQSTIDAMTKVQLARSPRGILDDDDIIEDAVEAIAGGQDLS